MRSAALDDQLRGRFALGRTRCSKPSSPRLQSLRQRGRVSRWGDELVLEQLRWHLPRRTFKIEASDVSTLAAIRPKKRFRDGNQFWAIVRDMAAMPIQGEDAAVPAAPNFRELFDANFSYVWNSLKRLGVAERDLEDLAQQVFLQVLGQLATFDTRRPVRPWLFSFAYNLASNYRSLARHRVELSIVAPEQVDSRPAADEQLITREELALAELALSRVGIERRAVLLLHEVEGHSVPEIAETLGIPLNTAYSRLRLAREDYELAVRRLRLRRGES